MEYIQNGVRNLKRHSIANISDVIRNHIHRDSIPGLGRHHHHRHLSPSRANLPLTLNRPIIHHLTPGHSIANISDVIRNHIHRDSIPGLGRHHHHRHLSPSRANLPLKNANFESVSAAVVHLFQQKGLQENELCMLQENVRELVTSDAGPLIYDYYKDKLMKKGMVILREKIKFETGVTLLTKLGEQWDYFYREILPVLQALLYPVKVKNFSIRQVTLLEFRNTVLLKLPVADALKSLKEGEGVSPACQQMLLVLQSVHERPCTDNYLALEAMVARVTCPYLGMLGVYTGSSEPEIRSNFRRPPKLTVIEPTDTGESDSDGEATAASAADSSSKKTHLSPFALPSSRLHQKRNSGLLHHPLLAAVKEQDRGQIRRYSIATS